VKSSRRFLALFTLYLGALCVVTPARAGGRQLWTAKLPGDAKWHALTSVGTLLVGTDAALLSFNPEAGAQLWRRDDITKCTPYNVKEVVGTPVLLVNNAGGFMGTTLALVGMDLLTGKDLWKAAPVQGQYLTTIPVPSKGLALYVMYSYIEGDGSATRVYAFDVATGAQKWVSRYNGSNLTMHIADDSGFFPRLDLSGHQEPLIDDDVIYLPYLGVHCLDLATGAIRWKVEFTAADKQIKRAYPPLRLDGDKLFAGGSGVVYCLDKTTGAVVWKTERIAASGFKVWHDAIIAQVEPVGDKVYYRMGGSFSNGKKVEDKRPLGVVCVDKATGHLLYDYREVSDSLTNLLPLPEAGAIMFCDCENLIGLDLAATGKAREKFRVKLEFKRKLGGGEVAQLGLGALGGLSGLAKAGFAQSKARKDPPVALLRHNGQIVVQGRQHVLNFDPATSTIKWSTYFAAPGGGLGQGVMFALTAMQAVAGNAQVAASGGIGSSGYNNGVGTIQSGLDNYNDYTQKRISATQSVQSRTFVLSSIEDAGQKGVGLVGINMASGEGDKKLILGTKEPEYQVDERTNRLFFFKGKDSVVAYEL
jgi:outer membrane protein assembly factor BamB